MVRLLGRLRSLLPGAARDTPAAAAVPPASLAWLGAGEGASARTDPMACPNCGAVASKTPVLAIRFTLSGQAERQNRLLRCADCTCLFYEDRRLPDYAEDLLLMQGRTPFYLQQGAGLGLLAGVLAQVRAPAGAQYLEVGCGFGFGLDFAARALGWSCIGIDPGGMASLGAERLGVRIERRYLSADEPGLSGSCDVVMAAETIEHVPSPLDFLRVLRSALRPGGVVVLTTPNGDALCPGTAPGTLGALLSPGYHLVFQTADSLRRLLGEAGFTAIDVRVDGAGLVAHASDRPLALETDAGRLRGSYLDYLERRAGDFAASDDLSLGLLGRLFQECVNAGELARAEPVYARLRDACLARFGVDLDLIDSLPDAALGCDLVRLAEVMPLALGGILHADAIRRLGRGAPRAALEERFHCAADAADALRAALRRIGSDDAMSEEIAWAARAEAALCAAERAPDDIVDRILSLPPSPGEGGRRRSEVIARAVVTLVNSGRYAPAREIADAAALYDMACEVEEAAGALPDGARDMLFCLAVLDVNGADAGQWARGAARCARLRARLPRDVPAELFWAIVRCEVIARQRLGDGVGGLVADAMSHGLPVPADLAALAPSGAAGASR